MKNNNQMTPYLKIADAAEATGLSAYFLRKGCKDGTVPCVLSGRTYFINIQALLERLDEQSRRV